MPSNQIDGSGISVQTFPEILTDIIEGTPDILGLKQIYGSDISTDSNTPDGQMINIFALAKKDILDFCVQIYNSKDPDQAIGQDLDSVSQLCGITRKGGTYTEVSIVILADRSMNLNGQDTSDPYTVSDANGNQFQLITSVALTSGNNSINFRAVNIGFVQVLANTINVPVSIILGVVSVNNPSGAYQIGTDQETDSEFRLRRQKSVAVPAQGMNASLAGGLNSLTGMVQAIVHENITNVTDADGIPAHAIWVIVDGGSDADVSDIIYKYRNAGCDMKGGTAVNIVQVDGTNFQILFDRVVYENLYIYFHLDSITSGVVDNTNVKTNLVSGLNFKINEPADITSITALIHDIDPSLVVTQCAVSKDKVTWGNTVSPSAKKNKFVVSAATISIVSSGGSSSSSSSSSTA